MRTLSSNVTTEKNRKTGARPFLTFELLFPEIRGGTLYLSERGNPLTIDSNLHYPIVIQVPHFGSTFGRNELDGTLDAQAVNVELTNAPVLPNGRFSDYFFGGFSGVIVDVYLNFQLDDTTVERFLRTSGVAQTPIKWTFSRVTLQIKHLMDKWLNASVLRKINSTDFPLAADGAVGKGIPLALGHSNGCRIPGLQLNTSSFQPEITICEDPPEMPVVGVSAVYWNGHAIISGDFSITEDIGVSESFPLLVTRGGESSNTAQEIYGASFIVGSAGDPSSFVSLGKYNGNGYDIEVGGPVAGKAAEGGTNVFTLALTQPIVFDNQLTVHRMAFQATKTDAVWPEARHVEDGHEFASGVESSNVRKLSDPLITIYDEVSWLEKQDFGIVSLQPEESGAQATSQIHNVTPQKYQAYALADGGEGGNDGAVFNVDGGDGYQGMAGMVAWADMGRWRPVPGVRYYVNIEQPYFGNPDDPGNQWHSFFFGDNNRVSRNLGDPNQPGEYGNVIKTKFDVEPLNEFPYSRRVWIDEEMGFPLAMHMTTSLDGKFSGDTSDFGGDGIQVGAIGLFHFTVEPSAARVLGAITMKLRKKQPTDGGPATELKGTLSVSISEVDTNGRVVQQLGSASFSAEDFNGTLGVNYTDAYARLSSFILLEANKRYDISLDGEMGAEGTFEGWDVQGFTSPILTGSGWSGGPSQGHTFSTPLSGTNPDIKTSFDEPIYVAMTFHCVSWQAYFTSVSIGGEAVDVVLVQLRLVNPTITGVDSWELPSGVQISADVTCNTVRPNDVAQALLERAGVPAGRIDTAGTFADYDAGMAAHFQIHGAVVEQITYKQLLARLAFESLAAFDWEDDKAQWKMLPTPGVTTSVRDLQLVDLVQGPQIGESGSSEPAITFTPTDNHDIVNLINMRYQRNYTGGEFFKAGRFANVSSIEDDALGELEKEGLFDMRFVRTDEMAADVGVYYLVLLSIFRRWVTLTTKLQTLELEKVDVIGLDLDDPALEDLGGTGELGEGDLGDDVLGGGAPKFGGLSGTTFEVRAVSYDWPARQVQYILQELG